MMKRQWMAFSIGLVALTAFVLLGAMILWFGEVRGALRPRREYYVTFTNALGAEVKAPVRRAGIRIGEISKVEYDEQRGLVVLTLMLDGENQLREGDEPRLRATSLLAGDTYVDVETRPDRRGRPDRALVPVRSVLEGRPPLDLGPAAETAQSMVPNANRTLDELQKTSKEWSQVGARANRILEQNEQEVNLILQQTRDSVERLNSTLQAINETLDPKSRTSPTAATTSSR
jgi:ABC-type transporter Mla subunit MlaD